MKKIILLFIFTCILSVARASGLPENKGDLPESYQLFKVKFQKVQLKKDFPKIGRKEKLWIGIGTGAAAFVVTEFFFYSGNFKNYHNSILIGAGVHLTTHLILMLIEDKSPGYSRGRCYGY
ncbi:MAG TPA: hypothetical protein VJ912_00365 [Candidatus Nanoarchaeia archaeon]|nr:hypothetical protein [Candidatus Nanoarchaeia archaeon]